MGWNILLACGGDITNASGYLTSPGYPNKLLSRVECVWKLNAGVGNRYELSLEFVDRHVSLLSIQIIQYYFIQGYYIPSSHSFNQQPCFGDVEVINYSQ